MAFIQTNTVSHIFVGFDSSHCSGQQFFSHVRMGFPGLSQYKAEDKVSCSMSQGSASGEAQTVSHMEFFNMQEKIMSTVNLVLVRTAKNNYFSLCTN